jgi:uncharacterized protein YbaR (Trm112 family)
MKSAANNVCAELLALMRCPETASSLTLADSTLLAQLNRGVADRSLHNVGGQPIEETFDTALVNADQTLVYPVIDRIPVMVPGEAIRLVANRHLSPIPPPREVDPRDDFSKDY